MINISTILNSIKDFEYRYSQKYNILPLGRNNRKWTWEEKDYPRVQSLLHFEDIINYLGGKIKLEKLLTFNGKDDPEVEILAPSEHLDINYEDDPAHHDLHTLELLPELEGHFDIIMINQTLEHVYDPILCLKNVRKYLKTDGLLYINVPSNNIPHGEPHHFYTGFTPIGVGALLEASGYEIGSMGYWGSQHYINFLFAHNTWPDYTQLPVMHNDKKCPCISWAFGVKK